MAKQSRCSNFRRRLAARIMKCGNNRIWFNPESLKKIEKAITRGDVRKLILNRDIKKRPENKKKTPVVKKKQRSGSRKGRKGARQGKKANWFKIVRPQRRLVKQLRAEDKLTPGSYRKLYIMVKSGVFRSKAHMKKYIDENNMMKVQEGN
jgi:large subunit ribosomal protein L19e